MDYDPSYVITVKNRSSYYHFDVRKICNGNMQSDEMYMAIRSFSDLFSIPPNGYISELMVYLKC